MDLVSELVDVEPWYCGDPVVVTASERRISTWRIEGAGAEPSAQAPCVPDEREGVKPTRRFGEELVVWGAQSGLMEGIGRWLLSR